MKAVIWILFLRYRHLSCCVILMWVQYSNYCSFFFSTFCRWCYFILASVPKCSCFVQRKQTCCRCQTCKIASCAAFARNANVKLAIFRWFKWNRLTKKHLACTAHSLNLWNSIWHKIALVKCHEWHIEARGELHKSPTCSTAIVCACSADFSAFV